MTLESTSAYTIKRFIPDLQFNCESSMTKMLGFHNNLKVTVYFRNTMNWLVSHWQLLMKKIQRGAFVLFDFYLELIYKQYVLNRSMNEFSILHTDNWLWFIIYFIRLYSHQLGTYLKEFQCILHFHSVHCWILTQVSLMGLYPPVCC